MRTLETLVFSPFLVTGAAIERQWLSVIFFQEFLNDPTSLATQINIQLQSQFIQVGLHKKGRVQRKNSEDLLRTKNQQNHSLHDKLQRRQESINQTENLSNQVMTVFTMKLFI